MDDNKKFNDLQKLEPFFFTLKCHAYRKSSIQVIFRALSIAKRQKYFDILPQLERTYFPPIKNPEFIEIDVEIDE